jgi:hypothetical protein
MEGWSGAYGQPPSLDSKRGATANSPESAQCGSPAGSIARRNPRQNDTLFLVPERLCDVTVTDEHGARHTIRVMARSVNTAACYFFARSRSSPAEKLPSVMDGTIYEVQPVDEQVVYRVEHREMLEWANRTAERQWRGQKRA